MTTIFWTVLVAALAPAAGSFQVEAFLDRSEVPLGEAAVLLVEARGDAAADCHVSTLAAQDGLLVESAGKPLFSRMKTGRDQGESILVRRWSWRLYPLRTGSFVIPPVEVTALGDTVHFTEPVRLHVKEGGRESGAPWRIEITLSSERVFLNQPVAMHVTLKCDSSRAVAGGEPRLHLPWLREGEQLLPIPDTRPQKTVEQREVEIIGLGRREVFRNEGSPGGEDLLLFRRFVFLPVRTGEYAFSPSFAAGPAARSGEAVRYHLAASPAFVVVPLPAEGRPPSFTNGVGRFRVSFATSAARVATGDTFFLTLAVEGPGNLELLKLPEFPELAVPFKVFSMRDEYGEGRKARRFELAPRRGGSKAVPELRFSYFDPEREEYAAVSFDLAGIEIVRRPGEGQDEIPLRDPAGEIGGLMMELPAGSGTPLAVSIWILVGALLFAGSAWGWDQRRRWVAAHAVELRARQAHRAFTKAMRAGSRKEPPDASSIMESFARYLEERFEVPTEETGTGDLREILLSRGVGGSLAGEAAGLVVDLEEMRFSPSAGGSEAAADCRNRAIDVVERLEGEGEVP